jgi:hypothetical protein
MSETIRKNQQAEQAAEEQIVNNAAQVPDEELDEVSGAAPRALYGVPDPD